MPPSQRLAELNLTLPSVATPVGSYLPALQSGRPIFTSGQLPLRDGKVVYTRKVPGDVSGDKAGDGAGLAVAARRAGRGGVSGRGNAGGKCRWECGIDSDPGDRPSRCQCRNAGSPGAN